MTAPIRKFDTGATRNTDTGKLDFDGFYSPPVMERFAKYMNKHRELPDGSLRDSDNWQAGIPLDVYAKSAWRHWFDVWKAHRGYQTPEGIEENLCALLFNAQGYLHEHLKKKAAYHWARGRRTTPPQCEALEMTDHTHRSEWDELFAEFGVLQSAFNVFTHKFGAMYRKASSEKQAESGSLHRLPKEHRRVMSSDELAYLREFGPNPPNCDGNRHPMMAEADRLTGKLG